MQKKCELLSNIYKKSIPRFTTKDGQKLKIKNQKLYVVRSGGSIPKSLCVNNYILQHK